MTILPDLSGGKTAVVLLLLHHWKHTGVLYLSVVHKLLNSRLKIFYHSLGMQNHRLLSLNEISNSFAAFVKSKNYDWLLNTCCAPWKKLQDHQDTNKQTQIYNPADHYWYIWLRCTNKLLNKYFILFKPYTVELQCKDLTFNSSELKK